METTYRECHKLGDGTFGKVILLKNIKTHSFTALKTLKTRDIDTKRLLLIMNEIVILKSLRHPFINRYKNDLEDTDGVKLYLTYESGGDLFTVFHEHFKHKMPQSAILFYIAEISIGVEYLHSLDIIHRDLKTENIFISSTGNIKIGDFGFACICSKAIETLGTMGYLAPEIIRGVPYTDKLDIWCIGIMTYELLYSCNPFMETVDQLETITMDKTLFLNYETSPEHSVINTFISKILVLERRRYTIKQLLLDPWIGEIDVTKLKNSTYEDIPYIPKEESSQKSKRLIYIEEIIKKSNNFLPVAVFDVEDNFKCIGFNNYFKTIFLVTKSIVHLEDFLNIKPSKCLEKIKDFIKLPCNKKFIHTKYIKKQDNIEEPKKIKCTIDTEVIKDADKKLILHVRFTPINLT